MYKVYILKSQKYSRYYIGHTEDLVTRLKLHNKGLVKSTKKFVPWELIYMENYDIRQDAYRREMQIKRYKGGRAFKELIKK